MCINIYIKCMHIYIHTNIYTCIYMYTRCVCVCVCVCVCGLTHTHTYICYFPHADDVFYSTRNHVHVSVLIHAYRGSLRLYMFATIQT